MPLPSPILDDRSYAQLAQELKARIPVYNPDWTDHNESDPAITLLELFAFQAENLLYRFNQVPEATYLEFLRLLQVPLRPAQAARALLALTTEMPQGVPVPQKTLARAGQLAFQTLTELTAWPLDAQAVARIGVAAPDADAEPEVYEFALRTALALPPALAEQPRVYFETRLLQPGEPLDLTASVDGMLWVALLAGSGYEAARLPGAVLNLGFEADAPAAPLAQSAPCAGLAGQASAPQLQWQVSTARPLRHGQPQYVPLALLGDSTRGLSQSGVLRLQLPRVAQDIGLPETDPDLAGAGDFPPPLPDELAARTVAWLRVFRRDGSTPGRFKLVVLNATEAEHARVAAPQFVGEGNAQPGQVYRLAHAPVLPDNASDAIRLEVEEAGQWLPYTRVDDFFGSQRESRHFVLDAEAGLVRFGDGLRGRLPQWGERIRCWGYRHGGGAAGNVPAGAIDKLELSGVKAANPLPAHGGADPEGLEEALARIPGELRRRDRAVTAGDFRELAAMTPGVQLGRAECLPRFWPQAPQVEAAGVVSVMVWPQHDAAHPDAPQPDAALLRAVCQWLDARRLVTTELYVIAPVYRKVAVSVAVHVKPGYGVEAVRRWVELVLRQYLAPLPPYGPEGRGWPLGRRVHGPELEAAALQVEGVEYLDALDVAGWDGEHWQPGTVTLARHEVPELAAISVVDGLPLPPPGEGVAPQPPDGVVLPLPVIRERC
ncbi:putative baseplate assembly protein [Chitiniphilus purpureus]|uniref:Baseplate assembly protein n=1 Tax=Chitiniphilus purpureus TaxID=2981137 RepID=A0ABY6DMG8_9NEIS|nr:putative baseplate assembly protein [Chitiniphilus sp. CD1]UXY14681.1 putative baseplate assembly protein [Chitiniphilus sp. CD1]